LGVAGRLLHHILPCRAASADFGVTCFDFASPAERCHSAWCCRIQLLPIFLALSSFERQHGPFQIVFVDGKPREWCVFLVAWSASPP